MTVDPDRVFQGVEIDLRGERVDPDLLRRVGENVVLRVRARGVPSPQVVLGGDTRHDTMLLMDSLSRGIINRGGSIILIGGDIAKTVVYFSAKLYGAQAVAYVTASHSAARYNGVKICFTEESPHRPFSLAAREVVNKRDDAIREYEQYLARTFGPEIGKGKSLVLDALHGASWIVAPQVLRNSKFDLECLHTYIDSKFSSLQDTAPDPTLPDNLHELRHAVKAWGGIGAAFDGDMDRVVFVDENTDIVPADEIAMIIGSHILQKSRRRSRVVYHSQSSNSLPEAIKKSKGKPIIQETGWRSIKKKMEEVDAVFGSEISGHFFYGNNLYYVRNGDDALFTTLMLFRVLQERGQNLAEARRDFPAYFTSPELRVAYDENRNPRLVNALRKRFEADRAYTLSVVGRDLRAEKYEGKQWCSWLVFRTSRTEPDKLSFRFEGRTLAHLAEIKRTLLDFIPEDDQPLKEMLDTAYKASIGDPAAYYRRALEAAGKV